MGVIKDFIRGRKADKAIATGGKHAKPKGGRHAKPPIVFCKFTWKDKGIPGSKHATYPHEDHACGSEPHNRGSHFCRTWECGATHA